MSQTLARIAAPPSVAIDAKLIARIALAGFVIREPFAGLIQWALSLANLSPLWYVPDGLAALCLLVLAFEDLFVLGRGFYLLLLIYLAADMALGFVVSESLASVVAGLKAVLPIFVGVLVGPKLVSGRMFRTFLYGLLALAVLGVPFSMIYPLPWAQLSFDAGFGAKQFRATIWATGGGFRPFGFASDQHGATAGIMMLWTLLGLSLRSTTYYLAGLAALGAAFLTTSRTGFLAFGILFALRYAFDRLGGDLRRASLSAAGIVPWLACLIPVVVIAFGTLTSRGETGQFLDSVWVRGNEVYLAPFDFMSSFFAPAWAVGFGLGGIGFPLLKSDYTAYASIVDNFNLWGYYTFGIPFVVALAYVLAHATRQADPDRRFIFCALVVFGQFILGWPTPPFMILLGYAIGPLLRASVDEGPRPRRHRTIEA